MIRTLWVACLGSVLLLPAGAADEGDDEAEEDQEESDGFDLAFTVGPGCVESTSAGEVSINTGSCLQIVRGGLRDAEQCDVWYEQEPLAPTSSNTGGPVPRPRFTPALC